MKKLLIIITLALFVPTFAAALDHERPTLSPAQEQQWLQQLVERSPHRLALQLAKEVAPPMFSEPALPLKAAKPAKEALAAKPGRRLYGYLPYWTMKTTKLHWKALTQLSWFCAELSSDGTFSDLHGWGGAAAKALIAEAHSHGVQVTLTITLFSTSGIHKVIETAAKRTKLVNDVINLVISGGGDGVNIDFEGLAKADRDNMKAFIIELNKTMKKKLPGADVTLATPAVDWSGAWDYDVLAENSDGLMVMAYGIHWTGGTPGPQLPMGTGKPWYHKTLQWVVDDYVKYGKVENLDKFIIGLPLYGNTWPSTSDKPGAKQTAKGKSVTYEKAKIEAPKKSGWKWDSVSKSSYYTYQSGGQWWQTWVDDPKAFKLRVDYLDQRNTQMGLWALGYADKEAEVWSEIDWFMGQGQKADPGADAGSTADAGSSNGGADAGGDAGAQDDANDTPKDAENTSEDTTNASEDAANAGNSDSGNSDSGNSDSGNSDDSGADKGQGDDVTSDGGQPNDEADGVAADGAAGDGDVAKGATAPKSGGCTASHRVPTEDSLPFALILWLMAALIWQHRRAHPTPQNQLRRASRESRGAEDVVRR